MLIRRATAIVMALGVLNLAIAGNWLSCAGPQTGHTVHADAKAHCSGEQEGPRPAKTPGHHSAPLTDCCPAVHACSFAFAAGADRAVASRALFVAAPRPAGAMALSAPRIPPEPPPPRV